MENTVVSENLTIYIGRLASTPILKENDNGKYCRIRIGLKKGDNYNAVPVTYFGRNAERLCELGKRGMTIYTKCRTEMRQMDLPDGKKFDYPSMVGDQFNFPGLNNSGFKGDDLEDSDDDLETLDTGTDLE